MLYIMYNIRIGVDLGSAGVFSPAGGLTTCIPVTHADLSAGVLCRVFSSAGSGVT